MVITWGYDSYFKTKEKMEWLVVPLMLSLRSSLVCCKLSSWGLRYQYISSMFDEPDDGAHMALRLYKLLSYLVARQQQVTIEQLATLQSIMTSVSNHQKPIRWYPPK
jgi:hypothetical protein